MNKTFTDRLAKLQADYAAKLPERVEAVRKSLDAYLAGGEFRDLEDAYRETHSLAGSAATFGQVEAGRAAENLKIALQSRREPKTGLRRADDKEIGQHLLALVTAAGIAKKI